MDACQRFFDSFSRQALELAYGEQRHAQLQAWWQSYYQDPNKRDYEMCDYCQTPFLRDYEDYDWICAISDVQECKQWCARPGCASDLRTCEYCGYGTCPDHMCTICDIKHCALCDHDDDDE